MIAPVPSEIHTWMLKKPWAIDPVRTIQVLVLAGCVVIASFWCLTKELCLWLVTVVWDRRYSLFDAVRVSDLLPPPPSIA